jgi:hypothetical protein
MRFDDGNVCRDQELSRFGLLVAALLLKIFKDVGNEWDDSLVGSPFSQALAEHILEWGANAFPISTWPMPLRSGRTGSCRHCPTQHALRL